MCVCVCVCVCVLSRVQLFAAPWTVDWQAPLSMGFPRQKYWSRLPFLSTGDLPDLGIKLKSPAFQAISLPLSYLGNPNTVSYVKLILWIILGELRQNEWSPEVGKDMKDIANLINLIKIKCKLCEDCYNDRCHDMGPGRALLYHTEVTGPFWMRHLEGFTVWWMQRKSSKFADLLWDNKQLLDCYLAELKSLAKTLQGKVKLRHFITSSPQFALGFPLSGVHSINFDAGVMLWSTTIVSYTVVLLP